MAARLVSFIIPAHNEEAMIGRAIESIHAAAAAVGRDHEIIVVDDASTDRTAAIARERGARIIPVDKRQIAAVRNAGAAEARGEFLVFVDGDTLLPAETLQAAIEAVDAGAVGGGCAVRFDGRVPLYARVALILLVIGFRWTRLAAGCFIFARRDAFEAAGGFDETLYASEEIALSQALKRQGQFVVLRENVLTSGRKVRQISFWSMLTTLLGQIVKGPRGAFRSREGLGLWYDAPRESTSESAKRARDDHV